MTCPLFTNALQTDIEYKVNMKSSFSTKKIELDIFLEKNGTEKPLVTVSNCKIFI